MSSNSKTSLPCGRPSAIAAKAPGAAQLAAWQAQLRDYLGGQGLKYSQQRWKIAELILSQGGHSDAQEVVRQVKRKHPEIGAATVYRNLKTLCDARILRESLTDAEGRVMYELSEEEHHDHIVCSDCGEIFEFHDSTIESRQNRVAREMSFVPSGHKHVIYASCAYLQARKKGA